jgi:hypothetical protein
MAFRLTADGRAYRKGKRIYANKDVYEVRLDYFGFHFLDSDSLSRG